MAYQEVSRVEIKEVLRHWQTGGSQRAIARATGLSRTTIRKYIQAARQAGLHQDGAPPTEEQLTSLAPLNLAGPRQVTVPTEATLEPWADQVHAWLTGDRLLLTRVQKLLAQRGCPVSYTSLRRFVSRHGWKRGSQRTVRMADTNPGEVAELDFGRLGLALDPDTGRRRVVWALVIVVTYSRHSFVWPLFSQQLADVIEGLEAAWAFFQGVPQYLVLDNFPAAIAGADALHPKLTHAFTRIASKAGLPNIRLHDLRHTHISMLIRAGVHARVIADRAGHSSISTTMDIYGHLYAETQREAAIKFELGLFTAPAEVKEPVG